MSSASAITAGAPGALADVTTLRTGGAPTRVVTARTREELVDAVRSADAVAEDVLLVGGGSNLVVADTGFDGVVVLVRTAGIELESGDHCGGAFVRVAAGHDWDDLVATAVGNGWAGLEALSGIPGTTGATPVQNVGAYGAQVSDTIAAVVTWDRREDRQVTFAGADCAFGYRTSRFKTEPGRHVVLEIVYQVPIADRSAPVRYAELARALGVPLGSRAPLALVREAVLTLRAGKGMVLAADDHDTWSVGSFFTNPILTPEQADALPALAPRFPADGGVKTSAAWLVQHAGFGPGTGLPGPAAVSTKHSLALTNRGGACTDDVLVLARAVRDAVAARFGVVLEPEPTLVGCSL